MHIRQILRSLEAFSPQSICLSTPTLEIFGVYVLQDNSLPVDPQLLYLCTQEQFERLPSEFTRRGCFALYQVHSLPTVPPESTSSLNLFILPDLDRPQKVYDLISQQFSLEHRLSIAMKPMLDALFSNQGIQHLIDVAYNILKNPLFVTDSSGRYIASAFDETSFDENGPFANYILNDILYGYVDNGGQNFIRKYKLDELIAKRKEPYEYYHQRFETKSLLCSLHVHDAVIGSLQMHSVEHPFTDLDRQLFSVLVGLVNQELQRDSQIVLNRNEKSARFLIDLITSSHADAEMMRRCTAAFKFTPDSSFIIAVSAQSLNASSASIYDNQLKALFPAYPSAIMDGHLVILINQNKSADTTFDVALGKLEVFAKQNNLPFGVSHSFNDLSYARANYELAHRTVVLGQSFTPEKYIVHFKDIVLSELFVGYQSQGKVANLIMPEVKNLLKYDQETNNDYAHTLETYLAHMGKSQKVCNELHIHKNTLLYRINKLSEYFGIDVESGDSAFKAYLSLQILKFLASIND